MVQLLDYIIMMTGPIFVLAVSYALFQIRRPYLWRGRTSKRQ